MRRTSKAADRGFAHIPVRGGMLSLGNLAGPYLVEHRARPHAARSFSNSWAPQIVAGASGGRFACNRRLKWARL